MPENMSISVNGQSKVPPGFRFHPTEEELLLYYLRKKVSYEKIDLDVIPDVDLNKLEPWDIQEVCKIGTTPQNDWYFFSHKDKKYPTGTRTNRATAAGFWKATGRDKGIYSICKRIGMRKTLVFYKGRAPHGLKSNWIMHEYRLDDNIADSNICNAMGEATQEEGWVVCRIFKRKNHLKTLGSQTSSSRTAEARTLICDSSNGETAMEEILEYMGDTSKEENEVKSGIRFKNTGVKVGYHETFLKLPGPEGPNSASRRNSYQPINPEIIAENESLVSNSAYQMDSSSAALTSWAALDRLAASHLNGRTEVSRQLAGFMEPTMAYCNDHDLQFRTLPPLPSSNISCHPTQDSKSEIDLWSFAQSLSPFSSSNRLCNLPNATV